MKLNQFKPFLAATLLSFVVSSCNIEPYDGDLTESSTNELQASCEDAIIKTSNEALNYANANPEDLNFPELCIAYKNALENQITVCGDVDGSIQTIINALGDCSTDIGQNGDGHAFMTANLKGKQFNDLKPTGYFFNGVAVSLDNFFVENEKINYLKVQGGTNIFLIDNLTEINLYIPENNWEVGTYDLNIDPRAYDSDSKEIPTPFISLVLTEGQLNYNALEGGKITITEFNLVERVIKGTFEFPFEEVSGNSSGTEIFQCKNGTFDYSLDDEYFD
ncbi:hypothetical protein GSB9_00797 [Flavobacteriaceae bacterium GSB9]|nr:hypothetical protein GSB9_00797 [Flavobacteriaceae bacterium GSB9]